MLLKKSKCRFNTLKLLNLSFLFLFFEYILNLRIYFIKETPINSQKKIEQAKRNPEKKNFKVLPKKQLKVNFAVIAKQQKAILNAFQPAFTITRGFQYPNNQNLKQIHVSKEQINKKDPRLFLKNDDRLYLKKKYPHLKAEEFFYPPLKQFRTIKTPVKKTGVQFNYKKQKSRKKIGYAIKLKKDQNFEKFAYKLKILTFFFFSYFRYAFKKLFFLLAKQTNNYFQLSISRYLHIEGFLRFQIFIFLKNLLLFQHNQYQKQLKFFEVRTLIKFGFVRINNICIHYPINQIFLFDLIELSYKKLLIIQSLKTLKQKPRIYTHQQIVRQLIRIDVARAKTDRFWYKKKILYTDLFAKKKTKKKKYFFFKQIKNQYKNFLKKIKFLKITRQYQRLLKKQRVKFIPFLEYFLKKKVKTQRSKKKTFELFFTHPRILEPYLIRKLKDKRLFRKYKNRQFQFNYKKFRDFFEQLNEDRLKIQTKLKVLNLNIQYLQCFFSYRTLSVIPFHYFNFYFRRFSQNYRSKQFFDIGFDDYNTMITFFFSKKRAQLNKLNPRIIQFLGKDLYLDLDIKKFNKNLNGIPSKLPLLYNYFASKEKKEKRDLYLLSLKKKEREFQEIFNKTNYFQFQQLVNDSQVYFEQHKQNLSVEEQQNYENSLLVRQKALMEKVDVVKKNEEKIQQKLARINQKHLTFIDKESNVLNILQTTEKLDSRFFQSFYNFFNVTERFNINNSFPYSLSFLKAFKEHNIDLEKKEQFNFYNRITRKIISSGESGFNRRISRSLLQLIFFQNIYLKKNK